MASAARDPRGGLSMRQTHGGGFQRTGGFERAKGTSTQTRWMSQTGERKGMGDSYFITSQNSNEAHKIYLNQGPPTQFVSGREDRGKTREKKKRERAQEPGAPYGHRMDYFMETQDRKAQIQQLEAQNRQLKIEFAKARHEFLELQYKYRQKDELDDEEDEEEDEKEEYAKVNQPLTQKILVMKGEIARFKDQLVLKKRELEGIKLVRRELSEAELTGKVQQIEEICTQLREESVILMRKYPGYREKEGIDAEDNQRYRFGNAVLSEYDELQEELTETLKRVIALKAKKLKDKEVRMEQIEKCKEAQMTLDGQIAELDTKIDELEADKKRRERYQGEDLGKVKEERESLMHEYAELDKALKELVKDKNAASTFQSKGQSELRNAFEERQKEYERLCRKRRLEEAAAEEEEQLQAQEKPEELTKTESFRAVRSSQVEGCVAVIQRRLALRGVDADQAFVLLLANDELAQDPDNMFVTLGSIESSLRKDPFFVPKKDVRMLARYLVEDNSQEMIEFRSDRTQAKIIVKSIFKTLLGHIPKRSADQLTTAFKKIREAILANKDQLLSNLLTIEKKDTLSSQKFGEGIRNVPPNLLELDENLKNLLVMHCIERFEPEDIKIPMLPEIFGEKEITERYIRSSKTKPTQSIASSSVQAPDTKTTVVPEASKAVKGVANTVTAPTQAVNKPTQGKQMVIDSEGEMDSEDDISREEFTPVAQGPPPSLVVNKVDTFNNPETKSRILSLEQIKAASEVKGAFGKLMFGGAAKPAGQDPVETKPADEKKPAANPLSFILGGNKKGAEGASSPKDSTPKATDKQVVVPPKPAPVQPADLPAKPSKPAVIFDDEYDEDEEIENMLSKNKNTTKD